MTERENLIDELAAVMAEHITAARSHGYAVDVAVAARAQLTALEAAGVRLVPVEATQEMTGAVLEPTASRYEVMKTYSDMIAASPYALKETGQ